MIIYKQFSFDSAHFLPFVPEGHKCGHMHGHTYTLTVYFEGELDPRMGWLVDFNEVKEVISPLIKQVDHKLLNDIPGLENPTSELLAKWFYEKIKPSMPLLNKVQINETASTGAIYQP